MQNKKKKKRSNDNGCREDKIMAFDSWPNERVPGELFDVNEGGVEHGWSDMEIPSQHREKVTTTISPEVR